MTAGPADSGKGGATALVDGGVKRRLRVATAEGGARWRRRAREAACAADGGA